MSSPKFSHQTIPVEVARIEFLRISKVASDLLNASMNISHTGANRPLSEIHEQFKIFRHAFHQLESLFDELKRVHRVFSKTAAERKTLNETEQTMQSASIKIKSFLIEWTLPIRSLTSTNGFVTEFRALTQETDRFFVLLSMIIAAINLRIADLEIEGKASA